ncbi:receptor-interacting serine/threonine-protein kinase 3 [Thalassophryne amazonica]|uniref:receptor-interacting serine/threonine-protein kinase 3 n=1 Tax=Thalassophryne amazonica TaxID=390379 RepID=UPI0014714824|nr:receptor-interacting serine/threonine-protein kinase 3 [Thalassophryne amazonica]
MKKKSASLQCDYPMVIEDSSLEDWKVIGGGGFGQVYKARHRRWGCDVAIKLLRYDDGSSSALLHEVNMMRQGSSPHVILVRGVFKGQPPLSGATAQLGLVMEFMERGSLSSLQNTLCGPPPWPLAFRLSHQVALGINFLHSLSPTLLHLDLKPSNVLLDCYLNAKLTDFGLARLSYSITRVSTKDNEEGEGGTISYMPPEAFELSYSPSWASDIYSYGILLWSILTGKQPYANVTSTIVRLRIPQGDRPLLQDIKGQTAGLERLKDLMVRCWAAVPINRPSSRECTNVTEDLHKIHKRTTDDAVVHVLKILDQRRAETTVMEEFQRVHITPLAASPRVDGNRSDSVLTGRPPVQEVASGFPASQGGKARVKDHPSPQSANMVPDDFSYSSTDHKVKLRHVYTSQAPPSPRTSPKVRPAANNQKPFEQNVFPQYQRQHSGPDPFVCLPGFAAGVKIWASSISGCQIGDNNHLHMKVYTSERKRHPTAPSSITLPVPSPHSGHSKDKAGGVG